MIALTSKVCIVGDFAVGKTSVVERFVNNHFSEKYLSTVGVKIDTKELEFPERNAAQKLVIWDVAGSDRFGQAEFAYLRGANGYIFVADGTRPATLGSVDNLRDQIEGQYGAAPTVLLINKRDLVGDWEVNDKRLEQLQTAYSDVYLTSAKSGDDVEQAIRRLAEKIIERDLERA